MKFVIDAMDPREYRIICTEAIWFKKILLKRPWMKGWEGIVTKAIEEPSWPIFRDAEHENRHIYYRLLENEKHQYIKVVVQFDTGNLGNLISAFPVDSGKTGEQKIWP